MEIEQLIYEVLQGVPGIQWEPGTFPQDFTTIKTQPLGCWNVSTGNGEKTSTTVDAIVDTTTTIILWAGSPEARAQAQQDIRGAFVSLGFQPGLAGLREAIMDADKTTFYTATLTFRGLIDTQTGWVYRPQ